MYAIRGWMYLLPTGTDLLSIGKFVCIFAAFAFVMSLVKKQSEVSSD